MNFLGLYQIGFTGKFGRRIGSDVDQLPVLSGHCGKLLSVFVNATREIILSLPVVRGICHIFRVIADPQIDQSVISCIPVDVVDLRSFRDGSVENHPNDSMSRDTVPPALVDKPSDYGTNSSSGLLVEDVTEFSSNVSSGAKGFLSSFIRKMTERSVFPEQFSAFRIIRETLAKVLDWWHDGARLIINLHMLFDFGFRAGRGVCLSGSFLLRHGFDDVKNNNKTIGIHTMEPHHGL